MCTPCLTIGKCSICFAKDCTPYLRCCFHIISPCTLSCCNRWMDFRGLQRRKKVNTETVGRPTTYKYLKELGDFPVDRPFLMKTATTIDECAGAACMVVEQSGLLASVPDHLTLSVPVAPSSNARMAEPTKPTPVLFVPRATYIDRLSRLHLYATCAQVSLRDESCQTASMNMSMIRYLRALPLFYPHPAPKLTAHPCLVPHSGLSNLATRLARIF